MKSELHIWLDSDSGVDWITSRAKGDTDVTLGVYEDRDAALSAAKEIAEITGEHIAERYSDGQTLYIILRGLQC